VRVEQDGGGELPWSKFYWKDWRADLDLRSVSFAARGLWIDLLTIMAQARPKGHLVIKGAVPSAREIAKILGGKPAEIARLLAELEGAGVPSKTADGVWFNRRMVRDAARSARNRENGANGGNPTLRGEVSDNRNQHGSVKPPDNRETARSVKPSDKARGTRDLEARSQKPESQPPSLDVARGGAADDDGSLGRWVLDLLSSPNLLHAGEVRLWLQRGVAPATVRAVIFDIVQRMRAGGAEWSPRSLKYFEAAVMEAHANGCTVADPLEVRDDERDQWLPRIMAFEGGTWLAEWGEAPGDSGCEMPARLQGEALTRRKAKGNA
jgi:hypothetical protein